MGGVSDVVSANVENQIVVAAITTYLNSIQAGKTPQEAQQDAVDAVVTAGIVQAFAKSSGGSYHDGGYTGEGHEYDVAGVVHAREHVATAEQTSKYNMRG